MSRKHTPSKKQHSLAPVSNRRQKTKRRNLTWLWVGLGVLILVVAGILLLSQPAVSTAGSSSTLTANSVEISPAQAYAKYQQGAFILDVRTQDEYDQLHIKGSLLIPLDQLPDRLNELSKDKDIVVVCLSGHRSLSGTTILQQAGFQHVSCLAGGLQAWRDSGYPLEGNAP